MKRAVFLDRDGVLNELVLNPHTGDYEPPRSPGDLVLVPGAPGSLRRLLETGFELFLVSNQPDYAKGKTSLENLRAVHAELDRVLRRENICFREYYYCHHHPDGIVPAYSYPCECRKPGPFFLKKAAREYDLDLGGSWMVGDRDSDIACGKAAGTRTILIEEPHSAKSRGTNNPDFKTANLKDAVTIILHH